MAALTIKNIPDELYTRLKESARLHHRSLKGEILYCVEQALGTRKWDPEEPLARALRRMTAAHPLTDEVLNAAKAEGYRRSTDSGAAPERRPSPRRVTRRSPA